MFEVKTFEWPLATGLMTCSGEKFIAAKAQNRVFGTRSTLPVEFFAHQLMAVDPRNVAKLYEFCRTYGIPAETTFYDEDYGVFDEWAAPFRMSDFGAVEDPVIEELIRENSVSCSRCLLGVRVSEVSSNLERLQAAVRAVQACALGSTPHQYSEELAFINVHVESMNSLMKPRSVTLLTAVCNQIVDTVASPFEWQVCERCRKPFKRRQDKPGAIEWPDEMKNPRKTKYCSTTCTSRSTSETYYRKMVERAFREEMEESLGLRPEDFEI